MECFEFLGVLTDPNNKSGVRLPKDKHLEQLWFLFTGTSIVLLLSCIYFPVKITWELGWKVKTEII